MNDAEDRVSKFYNTMGWETDGGVTEDAKRWEDSRENSREYVGKCRLRVLHHIPRSGDNLLDMASGPIQYDEYLEYSKNFKKRYCVDLSSDALTLAEKKIGSHGVFLHGSFFDIPLKEDFFDCSISLHTIYHIDKDRQEEAVRKLINVTKPGMPVIVVYGNPNTIISSFRSSSAFRALKSISMRIKRKKGYQNGPKIEHGDHLYFQTHPIEWWDRFEDIARVKIFPWRSFPADIQKKIIPDNRIGSAMFKLLFYLEENAPDFFVKHSFYPMIVLTKKSKKGAPSDKGK